MSEELQLLLTNHRVNVELSIDKTILRKQGIQVLDALRLVFMETPLFPSLQPE